ncbi:MAG: hypothetical protein U1E78_09430 [Gammaproteobacteria bacterium]
MSLGQWLKGKAKGSWTFVTEHPAATLGVVAAASVAGVVSIFVGPAATPIFTMQAATMSGVGAGLSTAGAAKVVQTSANLVSSQVQQRKTVAAQKAAELGRIRTEKAYYQDIKVQLVQIIRDMGVLQEIFNRSKHENFKTGLSDILDVPNQTFNGVRDEFNTITNKQISDDQSIDFKVKLNGVQTAITQAQRYIENYSLEVAQQMREETRKAEELNLNHLNHLIQEEAMMLQDQQQEEEALKSKQDAEQHEFEQYANEQAAHDQYLDELVGQYIKDQEIQDLMDAFKADEEAQQLPNDLAIVSNNVAPIQFQTRKTDPVDNGEQEGTGKQQNRKRKKSSHDFAQSVGNESKKREQPTNVYLDLYPGVRKTRYKGRYN